MENLREMSLNDGITEDMIDTLNKMTKEKLLSMVETRLVNYESNKESLENVPLEHIDDLAMFTAVRLSENAFFKVRNNMLESLGISNDELFDYAKLNKREHMELDSLNRIVLGQMNDLSEDERNNLPFEPPYVLSNKEKIFGASLIVDPVVMNKVKEMIGSDFYVLPSSIHEILLIPKGEADLEVLKTMVREVNENEVDEEDKLSDNVYECDGSNIKIASQELEKTVDEDITTDRTQEYVDYINENILSKIDYKQLQESYGTEEKTYAKTVLNALSQAAVEHYGTEYFDGFDENEYVVLPGIIRSKDNGNICLGLLEIDLQSSGEHCGTDFLVKYGCIPQFDEKSSEEVRSFIRTTYGSYDYMYTLGIETDHHVDIDSTHKDIREILDTFQNYPIGMFDEVVQKDEVAQDVLRGYVYGYDDSVQSYWFENSAENIAKFIMLNGDANKIIITDPVDRFVLSTMGSFLDKCADMEIRNEVVKSLVPMQMGGTEGTSIKVWDNDMNEITLKDDEEMSFEQ
ncbi:MAG: DUF5688 family protein [Lachnospiraceae bacterium]